jgi:hypothetical protein
VFDEEACEKLLAQAEQRRLQAIAAAESDYRMAVQTVKLLRSLRGPSTSNRLGHGKLSSMVLAAVQQVNSGAFTVRDIEARLQELAPEVAQRTSLASISTTLRRLVGTSLRLAEVGNGTRPSRYQRVEEGNGKAPLDGDQTAQRLGS